MAYSMSCGPQSIFPFSLRPVKHYLFIMWHSSQFEFETPDKKFSWLTAFNHVGTTERFTDLDKFNLVKFSYGGLVLGSGQFLQCPQLPQGMTLASKVVKSDSKIIISLCLSKYVTHSVSIKSYVYVRA